MENIAGIVVPQQPSAAEDNRAKDQAKAQAETIAVWHEAFLFCEREGSAVMTAAESFECLSSEAQSFLKEEMDWDPEEPEYDSICDAIRDLVLEDALSAQVRTEWHSLGDEPELGQYKLLLCTGGPAVQIKGDLCGGQPEHAYLEFQDWFTPWEQYEDTTEEQDAALLWYAEQFYWEQA